MKPADVLKRFRQAARGVTAFSLADQVVVSGTRFATTVMVGRFGSEAELGFYSLAFSVFVLFVSFQESLISIPYTVFFKQVTPGEQRKYAGSSLVHAVCFNVVAVMVLAVGCVLLQGLGQTGGVLRVLWILVVLLPCLLLREFARRFAFAHLQIKAAMVLDGIVSVLQLGGLLLLLMKDQMSAQGAFWISGAAAAVGVFVWWFVSRSLFQWQRSRIRSDWGRNRKFGKWVVGAHLITVLHTYFAHWLLAVKIDEVATGVFAACMTVVVLANPFILGMGNVLAPKAAHAYADDGIVAAGRIVTRFLGVIAAVLIFYAAAAAFYGNRLIVWIFDQNYDGHGVTVTLLAFGTLALGVNFAIASGLRAINRPAASFWAAVLGFMVTAVISFALIESLQILGTAIGLVAGYVVMAVYRFVAFYAAVNESTRSSIGES